MEKIINSIGLRGIMVCHHPKVQLYDAAEVNAVPPFFACQTIEVHLQAQNVE